MKNYKKKVEKISKSEFEKLSTREIDLYVLSSF